MVLNYEQFMEVERKCWDCGKPFKVKDMIFNFDIHYHCKECAKKYGR